MGGPLNCQRFVNHITLLHTYVPFMFIESEDFRLRRRATFATFGTKHTKRELTDLDTASFGGLWESIG